MSHEYAVMPKSDYTAACNAIRTKRGTSGAIKSGDLATEIAAINTGTDTSDATAKAEDIAYGKTAYVNGTKITGTNTTVQYSVTGSITNGSMQGGSISVGGTATFTIVASSGYELPAQADITVTNATITAYNSSTGALTIGSATGNVTITATCPQSAPVSYIILAGTYNGLDNPSGVNFDINLPFTSNNTSYANMNYDGDMLLYGYDDKAYDRRGWSSSLRQITVTTNTTVTQSQYDAFFGWYAAVYTIPAGTYYGKSSPSFSANINIWVNFTADGESYSQIGCEINNNYYWITYYDEFSDSSAFNGPNGWYSPNRTITVTQDTTVTQDEYNAFFACFGGYSGTVSFSAYGVDQTIYLKFNGNASSSSYDAIFNNPTGTAVNIDVPSGVYFTFYCYNRIYLDNHPVNCTLNGITDYLVSASPSGDNWSFDLGYDD